MIIDFMLTKRSLERARTYGPITTLEDPTSNSYCCAYVSQSPLVANYSTDDLETETAPSFDPSAFHSIA